MSCQTTEYRKRNFRQSDTTPFYIANKWLVVGKEFLMRKCKVIAVTNQKGGVGKTT